MKEIINWKSIVVALIVMLVGVLMIVADIFWIKTHSNVWISIGCSLIASGMVIILTALLIERKEYDPLDEWKLSKIYNTRAERNAEANPKIGQAQYRIDGIVFGLSSFRPMYSDIIEQRLKKGVNIRILTMDPYGKYMCDREREEIAVEGSIKKTIEDLVDWANGLNKKKYKGKIVIKCYSCMTLDYYWRVDNELYIGPYWYGYKSADTITYKFTADGRGFQHYSKYFEKLWEDDELCKVLTNAEIEKKKNGRKKV